jgi:hypothetical protein
MVDKLRLIFRCGWMEETWFAGVRVLTWLVKNVLGNLGAEMIH